MRVITGLARGRKLQTPPGLDTRPTSDMVKEAIFSIVQFEVEQALVLDLFAGSGQLGIEALSRGARFCVFVDNNRTAQEVIRENLQTTKLAENSRVVHMEATAFLSTTKDRFDIALLDAPYDKGLTQKVLPAVAAKMQPNGIIVCETARTETLSETAGDFAVYREYRYGKIKLTTYKKGAENG